MICESLSISDFRTQSAKIFEAGPDFFSGAKPEKMRQKRMLAKIRDGIVIIIDLEKMHRYIRIDRALEEGGPEGEHVGPRA